MLSALHTISKLILTTSEVVLLLPTILKARKWRPREDQQLALDRTVGMRQGKDSHLGPPAHEPLFLPPGAIDGDAIPTVQEAVLGIINECEACIIASNALGKCNGVITRNNPGRRSCNTVVGGLCSNSAPSLPDLLSLKWP